MSDDIESGTCECCEMEGVPLDFTTCDPAVDLNLEPDPNRQPLGDGLLRPATLKLCTCCQDHVPERDWEELDEQGRLDPSTPEV